MDKKTDVLYDAAIKNGIPKEFIESIRSIIINGELRGVIKDIPDIVKVISEITDSNETMMSKLLRADSKNDE